MRASALVASVGALGLIVAVALAPNSVPIQGYNLSKVTVENPKELTSQLSTFLKFRTVGDAAAVNHIPTTARHEFQRAVEYLQSTYTTAFRAAKTSTISNHSLLLDFQGSDRLLKPFALLSHYDVVPADAATWQHHPFSGAFEDGYIWGRGALDLKSNVIAILHAVNQLTASGTFRPKRTFFVALGHDEEVGGREGAQRIVQHLQQRNVTLDFVLDEGGCILKDALPPLTRVPIALVGTAEKDYSILRINVSSPGGHSSMPPVDGSSVSAILSRILMRIERHPSALRIQSPTTEFLVAMSRAAPWWGLRALLSQAPRWPINFLIARLMSLSPSTNAVVATTMAVTTLQAGGTHNVLPQSGSATFNLRHLPGHTAEQAKQHLLRQVPKKDRHRVQVDVLEERMTGHTSPTISPQFNLIKRIIQETRWSTRQGGLDQQPFVAPYLVVGGTDSKHYAPISQNIYRFQPVPLNRTGGELLTIHGTDERIHHEDLEAACRFFLHLITVASGSAS